MALGKGIPVINGFDLNSKLPLDSRAVVDTTEDMNKLVTDVSVGDGQLCYCKEDKKLYVLKDNAWSEVGGEGKGLNILSLNLKNCMNESDYNELVGYILQKAVIAKTYNITLPDLTDVDVVKFAIETPIVNTNATFYRNSKTITQFNWLCNWADNENFMQMVTITGNTDNNVNYIKYNGIDSGGGGIPIVEGTVTGQSGSFLNSTVSITIPNAQTGNFILHIIEGEYNGFFFINNNFGEYNATVDNSYDSNILIHNIMIISGSGTSIKIQQIAITNNYFINGSIDSTNKITIPDKPISPFFCQIINEDGELYKMYQVYTNPSTDISYGYGEFDVDSNSFTYITNKGQATKNEFKEYKIVIPKVV